MEAVKRTKVAGPDAGAIRKAYERWRDKGVLGSKSWSEKDQQAAEVAAQYPVEVLRGAAVMRQAFVNEQEKRGSGQ